MTCVSLNDEQPNEWEVIRKTSYMGRCPAILVYFSVEGQEYIAVMKRRNAGIGYRLNFFVLPS